MDFCGDLSAADSRGLINLVDLLYYPPVKLNQSLWQCNFSIFHGCDFLWCFFQVTIWQKMTGKLGEGNAPFTESLVPSSACIGGVLGLFLSCSFTQRAEVFSSSVSTKLMPWSCAMLTCLPIGISLHLHARAALSKASSFNPRSNWTEV